MDHRGDSVNQHVADFSAACLEPSFVSGSVQAIYTKADRRESSWQLFRVRCLTFFLCALYYMQLPPEIEAHLKAASFATGELVPQFRCSFFPGSTMKGDSWNSFVTEWAPTIYTFVQAALGPYGTQPLPDILPLEDRMVAAGANASFNIQTGQIRLGRHVEGNPGMTLEKLTHEMIHGSLAQFPEGDVFFEEGTVDYSVYVLAHAPIWGRYRDQMIEAAAYNIECRRERAQHEESDEYDRKRWAGGLFTSTLYGPRIITRLLRKKIVGNLTW